METQENRNTEQIEEQEAAPETTGTAAEPAPADPAGAEETRQTGRETFTLKHLDEQREVSREELIALAQKGLDYDRIRADRDRLKNAEAPNRREGLTDFLRAFPDVKPETIPKQVWLSFAAGESLTTAYTMYRNQTLEAELAAERQNRANRLTAAGSVTSGGKTGAGDELLHTWYADD